MGRVGKRDEDTAVVIPTSDGRKDAKDPDPVRRRELDYQEPIPDGEWIRGEVSMDGFTLATPGSGRAEEDDNEWIHSDEAINAEDNR